MFVQKFVRKMLMKLTLGVEFNDYIIQIKFCFITEERQTIFKMFFF